LQLYELAASGVRERAKLRQEVNEVQHELQGTRRQLHAFMASLMQLKNSMASAGEGDLEHALELLQASSYSQSLNSKFSHLVMSLSSRLWRSQLVMSLSSSSGGSPSRIDSHLTVRSYMWCMVVTLGQLQQQHASLSSLIISSSIRARCPNQNRPLTGIMSSTTAADDER
jgi:hypothetical protein